MFRQELPYPFRDCGSPLLLRYLGIEAGVNHYALAQNVGTSVAMLEQYYGHTTNVGMVEELTKAKTKRVANADKDGGGLGRKK